MKLYYYQKTCGNFGDDLNLWLWKNLFPDAFDEDDKKVFFGIGTIINDRIYDRAPNADRIIIFSSGVGYGKTPLQNLPTINDRWKVYCLRGPLSAKALGVSPDLAITDGAVLIRRLFEPQTKIEKKQKFSYMPHVDQAVKHGEIWQKICQQAGYGYIDPRWTREEVLTALCQTETLITEAMHGAIVADALRVPWIPVKTSSSIFEFKWWDWCKSLDLEYTPHQMSELPSRKSVPSRIKKFIISQKIVKELKAIAESSTPILSNDGKIEQLTTRLEEKVESFRKDMVAGSF